MMPHKKLLVQLEWFWRSGIGTGTPQGGISVKFLNFFFLLIFEDGSNKLMLKSFLRLFLPFLHWTLIKTKKLFKSSIRHQLKYKIKCTRPGTGLTHQLDYIPSKYYQQKYIKKVEMSLNSFRSSLIPICCQAFQVHFLVLN